MDARCVNPCFSYASLERGHISAVGSALGAPYPDMAYYTYRQEMGKHLENLRKNETLTEKEN